MRVNQVYPELISIVMNTTTMTTIATTITSTKQNKNLLFSIIRKQINKCNTNKEIKSSNHGREGNIN